MALRVQSSAGSKVERSGLRVRRAPQKIPTPNAQRPTPNAQRPTPNAQRPTPNGLQPPQQLPHFRQVPAADRYPLRMATQYQLMAAGGQGFQPFDAIQRHQRAAMGADKAGGEFFFQLFQRFVDQGF